MTDCPTAGLAVDVGTQGNPGIIEWCIVDMSNGIRIYASQQYPDGTNNIGEALAIVHALAWLARYNRSDPVYSDSFTARTWIAKRRFKSKHYTSNAELAELIRRAEHWLMEHPDHAEVRVWDTKAWGEVPADYGRKHEARASVALDHDAMRQTQFEVLS